jgi:putative SOS response-associated peptidase YedK
MCGRYILIQQLGFLAERFDFPIGEIFYQASYNIAPSQSVLMVTDSGKRKAEYASWGLIPSWAKDRKFGFKIINARAETVATNGAFRNAFKHGRCLILADGFYEWKREAGYKTPIRIGLKDWEPFGFAGLWESWRDQATGQETRSCAIITCPPNDLVEPIHNRMPVILPEDAEATWLDPRQENSDTLRPLLLPYPSELMTAHAVSGLVNSVKNNTPECIQEVGF